MKKPHNCIFSLLALEYQMEFLSRYSQEYLDAFDHEEIDSTLFADDI